MDGIAALWANIKQLVTSRTIWGLIVVLASQFNIHLNGLDSTIVSAGDNLMTLIGSVLAVIGYIDRRPKASDILATASAAASAVAAVVRPAAAPAAVAAPAAAPKVG